MQRIIFILILSLHVMTASGQDEDQSYSLQECIEIALENNLDLSLAKLGSETAEVNFKRSRNALLPRLNGTYNLGSLPVQFFHPPLIQ